MSSNLPRLSDMSCALAQTPFAEEASRVYMAGYRAAHAHPRKSKAVKGVFRGLRKMAMEAGLWDSLKGPAVNSPDPGSAGPLGV